MGKIKGKEHQQTETKAKIKHPLINKNKISRVKMPNFKEIHNKQFMQMESLVDHVTRKVERAQKLTNSNIKCKTTEDESAQKLTTANLNTTKLNNTISKNTLITNNVTQPLDPLNNSKSNHIKKENVRAKCARQKIDFSKNLNKAELIIKPKNNNKENFLSKSKTEEKNSKENSKVLKKLSTISNSSFKSNEINANNHRDQHILQNVRTNRRFELQMRLKKLASNHSVS